MFKEIFRYRELLVVFTLKSIKVRYKQALFGIGWAIFTPLMTMLIFTFLNKAKILTINTGDIPYPIFAYCGLLPWTFFADSLSTGTSSVVSNAALVTRVYFPRAILPISAILSKMIDLAVAAVILVGMMFFYRVGWHITILVVPFILLIQIVLTLGLSLLFAQANVFYRDVGFILGVVIRLWMFATSVIYPISVSSPTLQSILMLNPMTPIINSYRDLILRGIWPDMSQLTLPIAMAVVLFMLGALIFHKTEHLFAENI